MGDRVYYTRNGKRISRRIPETVHKTPNMKKRSANFGIASRAAGVTRKLLIDVLPFPTDRDMQNKFGGAFSRWLSSTSLGQVHTEEKVGEICGFAFSGSKLPFAWIRAIGCSYTKGKPVIHIPAFIPADNNKLPKDTMAILCKVAATTCRLKDGKEEKMEMKDLEITVVDGKTEEQDLTLNLAIKPGHIFITVLSVKFKINEKGSTYILYKEGYQPSLVLGANYKKS